MQEKLSCLNERVNAKHALRAEIILIIENIFYELNIVPLLYFLRHRLILKNLNIKLQFINGEKKAFSLKNYLEKKNKSSCFELLISKFI